MCHTTCLECNSETDCTSCPARTYNDMNGTCPDCTDNCA
jgi:hypothetical protein